MNNYKRAKCKTITYKKHPHLARNKYYSDSILLKHTYKWTVPNSDYELEQLRWSNEE